MYLYLGTKISHKYHSKPTLGWTEKLLGTLTIAHIKS